MPYGLKERARTPLAVDHKANRSVPPGLNVLRWTFSRTRRNRTRKISGSDAEKDSCLYLTRRPLASYIGRFRHSKEKSTRGVLAKRRFALILIRTLCRWSLAVIYFTTSSGPTQSPHTRDYTGAPDAKDRSYFAVSSGNLSRDGMLWQDLKDLADGAEHGRMSCLFLRIIDFSLRLTNPDRAEPYKRTDMPYPRLTRYSAKPNMVLNELCL